MYKQMQILIFLLYPYENEKKLSLQCGVSKPKFPVDPPLFQMPSWENRVLGNALPMRNAGLQSNMFYLQGIHFYITFF